ncbi:MAG TPA: hydrogenase small subunit [Myxococcaceae bacterium]|nr:hydrogenase small subunit [Myxococcaceae bacterium]
MGSREGWLTGELRRRGISRRELLFFCAGVAGSFGLPASAATQLASALTRAKKPILVWLEFQDCCGNSESFLRSDAPAVGEVILDLLSVDYHETLMAAAGSQAEEALDGVVKNSAGQFIAVVEGSIPTGADGGYCTIGGRSALDIARNVCSKAAATIAMGTCATYGGLPAAAPNPTGALGVADAVPGVKNLINMSACPTNAANITALLVYYLTYKHWPPLDGFRRPLFAYGKTIHDNCERRAHFDAGQYVEMWGDDAHRSGACLYKMGCKGPVTHQNCPTVRWNEGTNWPIGCGHPCIGCAEPDFWDKMTPFYQHLPDVPGFRAGTGVDTVGAVATAGVAAALVGHGVLKGIQNAGKKKGNGADPPGDAGTAGKAGGQS